MCQGTYNELQHSGLDIASLLRSEEEQDRLSELAEPGRLSLYSQRSNRSQCSHSSLLPPPESTGTEQLPVGTFSKKIIGIHFSVVARLHP